MRLDEEASGDALKLMSGPHGSDVPSACTIVIIAGNLNTETGRGFENFLSTLSGQCNQPVQLINRL